MIEERRTDILERMEEIERQNSIAGFDEILLNYRDVILHDALSAAK